MPADVSIVGFDDVPEAAYFTPPLTTVRPDFDAAATASLELLLEQINGGPGAGTRRTIAPALIERDSVAPPRLFRDLVRSVRKSHALTRLCDRSHSTMKRAVLRHVNVRKATADGHRPRSPSTTHPVSRFGPCAVRTPAGAIRGVMVPAGHA